MQATRLDHSFREKLKSYSDSELPVKDFVESLMTNTTRDDFSSLPKIYPPEREHQLSAIFVECDTPLVSQSCTGNDLYSITTVALISAIPTFRDVMEPGAPLP